jgi:hypothetical protein
METVDRKRVSSSIFDALKQKHKSWDAHFTDNVIASSAEGYPFPTNLDMDTAKNGLAPLSQA